MPSLAPCDVSVVVPLYNEVDNVDPCVAELLEVLDRISESSEVILVDDGSRDDTLARAEMWAARDRRVRVVQFRRNFGQTAAISAGFDHARGATCILMDGDQQNDPNDIPRLLEMREQGYDVVSGWRKDRKDKLLLRRFPSKCANSLISRITGIRLHDYGCTLKAYDAEVVSHLNLYGELHRFIPALAAMSGASVIEIPVNHRARTRGRSKYGISRTFRVLLDLITVKFLIGYIGRPMQFVGRLGITSVLAAILCAVMIPIQMLAGFRVLRGETWTSMAVLLLVLAAVFVSLGLIGEMITRVYHEGGARTPYVVRRVVEGQELTAPPRTTRIAKLPAVGGVRDTELVALEDVSG